jgi:hypothetical protein
MEMLKRRLGTPRSDEERRIRHSILYPGEKLPPRGTGLGRRSSAGLKNSSLITAVLGSLLLFVIVSITKAVSSAREDVRVNSGAESHD